MRPEDMDHKQHRDATNTVTCPYCHAKPMEWCTTSSGQIAMLTHAGRLAEWRTRTRHPANVGPTPVWTPVTLAKARVVTIEVLLPVSHDYLQDTMLETALVTLRGAEGYAQVVGEIFVEQTLAEAAELLCRRKVTCGEA